MIQLGDRLPDGVLYRIHNTLQILSIRGLFKRKRVLLLGFPGVFTPCSPEKTIAGFIANAQLFHSKGITDIYCLTANDPFVVNQWSKIFSQNHGITFLADGSVDYTKALGMDCDLSEQSMGVRSRQYLLYVDNLVVRKLIVDEPERITADHVLNLFI